MVEKPILKIEGLRKKFGNGCECCLENPKSFKENRCPECGTVWGCKDISFEVYPGEILGVVGESGSGKSTMMKCLYFDQEVDGGEGKIHNYESLNIFSESSQKRRYIRNNLMGMVYQNPLLGLRLDYTSIGNIAEKLIAAGDRNVSRMTERGKELLTHVEIPLNRMKELPKNFSGGMQQRVQISKALANNPPILLLDEVTTGLDLSVQAKVLDLIKTIQRDLGVATIVVSHDLGVIRMLADRTIVMLQGEIIEEGLTDQILDDPQHYYTQQLVHSLL
ncbi:MAG: ATP-binding cassette domain-containing protein [Cetobacterium sp.]|uniref:ATP-binding cassette domain-containing protein n=1 Tax=Cetobacterium sp. TaxID=2071632 RepID=UPI003F3ACD85